MNEREILSSLAASHFSAVDTRPRQYVVGDAGERGEQGTVAPDDSPAATLTRSGLRKIESMEDFGVLLGELVVQRDGDVASVTFGRGCMSGYTSGNINLYDGGRKQVAIPFRVSSSIEPFEWVVYGMGGSIIQRGFITPMGKGK